MLKNLYKLQTINTIVNKYIMEKLRANIEMHAFGVCVRQLAKSLVLLPAEYACGIFTSLF